jgi:putative ABC transport system substrate-binding protein
MAGKILKGADPASLKPYRATAAEHTPIISGKKLQALGLTLPAALKDCKCVVE